MSRTETDALRGGAEVARQAHTLEVASSILSPATIERVCRILADQLGLDEAQVVPGARIDADLGADSLDRIELVMVLEEAFDIDITDDQADLILTVQDAVDAITQKIQL